MSKNHKITIRLMLVLTSVIATFMGLQMLIMVDLRHYAVDTPQTAQEIVIVPNEDVAGDLPPLNVVIATDDPPAEETTTLVIQEEAAPTEAAVSSEPTIEPTLAPTATTVPVASAPILTIVTNTNGSTTNTTTTEQQVAIVPPVAVVDNQAATVAQESTSNAPANTASTSTGQYIDGEYLGTSVRADHWGNMQVNVIIQNGQIADVEIVEYPHSTQRSNQISSNAIPQLVSETIQNQSANIDIVSRATDTSRAFISSLNSALSSAAS